MNEERLSINEPYVTVRMHRAIVDYQKRKVELLKSPLLLTHKSVSSEEMNRLSAKQWAAYVAEYPEEAEIGVGSLAGDL